LEDDRNGSFANRLSKLTQLWSNDVPEKCGAKTQNNY
jgi:hypothetical protein